MTIPNALKEVASISADVLTSIEAGRRNNVSVNMLCQEADQWCWAAVTQAVENFVGNKTITQSTIATDHVAKNNAGIVCSANDTPDPASNCADPCQGGCNSPHRLSRVLTERGRLVNSPVQLPPTFEDVVKAIDNQKPLPVRVNMTGGAHFICVVGYSDDGNGNKFVDVLDPLIPGRGQGPASVRHVPFTSFVGGKYKINSEPALPDFFYDVRL